MTERFTSPRGADASAPDGPLFPLGEPDPPPGGGGGGRRGLRVAGWVGLGVLVLGASVYGVAYAKAGRTVPDGTTVLGVSIGGLSESAARARLEEELVPLVSEPFAVTLGGETTELDPVESGLTVDVPGTVRAAGGASALPWQAIKGAWREIASGGELHPVIRVDETALRSSLRALADRTDREPADGVVAFEGGAVAVTDPVPGRTLDQDVAFADVVREFPSADPIDLLTDEAQPAVGSAEVRRAVQEFAEPALSGPVTVLANGVAGKSAVLTPQMLSAALSMAPDSAGVLQPRLDGAALHTAAASALAQLENPAVDASVVLEGGKPVVKPSVDGRGVLPAELEQGVLPVLTATTPAERTTTVELGASPAAFTTAQAEALGVKEIVGEFTTYFPHTSPPYRNTNIVRAGALVSGTLLKPGDVFSLNDTIGERTRANGYVEGGVIENGQFTNAVGGGVSQVATTTYNAAFFAGLEDVEHRAHSVYLSRYPMGREATLAWGVLDLKFKNNTPYGVLIDTTVVKSAPGKRGSITVRMWSTKHWEVTSSTSKAYAHTGPQTRYDTSSSCRAQPGSGGFQVDVTRRIALNGEQVKTEKIHTHYRGETRVVCGPKP